MLCSVMFYFLCRYEHGVSGVLEQLSNVDEKESSKFGTVRIPNKHTHAYTRKFIIHSNENLTQVFYFYYSTRMHSSRIRTDRPLTVCHACLPPHHARLPPHMPPLPRMLPVTHAPPAMHAPLPCTPPPVDRILDTRFWKYYLAGVNNVQGRLERKLTCFYILHNKMVPTSTVNYGKWENFFQSG